MLPDIDGSADETLAVNEVVEGEGEVRGLVEEGLLGAVERLEEPLAETDKVFPYQTPGKRRKQNNQ
jgi:hypothetical protein